MQSSNEVTKKPSERLMKCYCTLCTFFSQGCRHLLKKLYWNVALFRQIYEQCSILDLGRCDNFAPTCEIGSLMAVDKRLLLQYIGVSFSHFLMLSLSTFSISEWHQSTTHGVSTNRENRELLGNVARLEKSGRTEGIVAPFCICQGK